MVINTDYDAVVGSFVFYLIDFGHSIRFGRVDTEEILRSRRWAKQEQREIGEEVCRKRHTGGGY